MSKTKVIFLIIGLVAAGAIVFAAAERLSASSPQCDGKAAAACGTHAKAAASGGCSPASAASCPMAVSGKGCPGSTGKSCGSKVSAMANVESVTGREGESMTLTGHYVCGRCDLGVNDACRPGFQTKDGKNYLLVNNNLSKRLREMCQKAKDQDVEIVTRVKKLDGVKYLEVEAIRSAS